MTAHQARAEPQLVNGRVVTQAPPEGSSQSWPQSQGIAATKGLVRLSLGMVPKPDAAQAKPHMSAGCLACDAPQVCGPRLSPCSRAAAAAPGHELHGRGMAGGSKDTHRMALVAS